MNATISNLFALFVVLAVLTASCGEMATYPDQLDPVMIDTGSDVGVDTAWADVGTGDAESDTIPTGQEAVATFEWFYGDADRDGIENAVDECRFIPGQECTRLNINLEISQAPDDVDPGAFVGAQIWVVQYWRHQTGTIFEYTYPIDGLAGPEDYSGYYRLDYRTGTAGLWRVELFELAGRHHPMTEQVGVEPNDVHILDAAAVIILPMLKDEAGYFVYPGSEIDGVFAHRDGESFIGHFRGIDDLPHSAIDQVDYVIPDEVEDVARGAWVIEISSMTEYTIPSR